MIEKQYMYNPKQIAEIKNYIAINFGGSESDYIAHEIKSEYVHTDVAIIDNMDDLKVLATFGMGARAMNSPIDNLNNIELVGFASQDLDVQGEETLLLTEELVRLSKYPFSDNTWFGEGHTINVSDTYKETFGYDYFLFVYSGFTVDISGIGNIPYLTLIPIYDNEYDWIVKNNFAIFLENLFMLFGANAFMLDKQRKSMIS